MTDIFLTIVKYLWVADFTVLGVFFVLYLRNGQVSSSLLTMVVVVVISFIVIQYEILVFTIKGPYEAPGYLIAWCTGFFIADLIMAFTLYRIYEAFKEKLGRTTQLFSIGFAAIFMIMLGSIQFGPLLFEMAGSTQKLWVRVAFYLGNVVLYTIATYAIQKLHEANKVPFSIICRMTIIAFFAATNLQIFRFLERLTWDTNYLAPVYKWGFVSINSCTTAVTLFIATLAIYNHYSRAKRKGVLWNI